MDRGDAGHEGFTLVETVMVVLILGILVAVAVGSYMMTVRQAHRVTCRANQHALTRALVQYEADNYGNLPTDLQELSPYTTEVSTAKRCPADGRELELVAGEVVCSYPGH